MLGTFVRESGGYLDFKHLTATHQFKTAVHLENGQRGYFIEGKFQEQLTLKNYINGLLQITFKERTTKSIITL